MSIQLSLQQKLLGTIVFTGVMLVTPWWLMTNNLNQLADKSEKASMANRVIKLTSEARIEEKNFIQRNDLLALEELQSNIRQIQQQVDEFLPRFKNPENIDQLKKIQLRATDYLSAIHRFKQQKQQTEENLNSMVRAARELEQQATDMSADKKQEREQILVSQKQIVLDVADKVEKASMANRLIKLANEARIAEKNHQIRLDQQYIDSVRSRIQDIEQLVDLWLPRFKQLKNINQLNQIAIARESYLAAFYQQVKLLTVQQKQQQQQQQQQEVTMRNEARKLKSLALDLRASQKQQRQTLLEKQALLVRQIADKTDKAQIANLIIKLTKEARIEEKKGLSGFPKGFS